MDKAGLSKSESRVDVPTAGISDAVRRKVSGLFQFVAALHQRRNPVARQLPDAEWKISLERLPDYQTIERCDFSFEHVESSHDSDSAIDNNIEAISYSGASRPILRVGRPEKSAPPFPSMMLEPWLVKGWQDAYTSGELFLESRTVSDPAIQSKTNVVLFANNPDLVAESIKYQNDWNAWAEHERKALAAGETFQSVYELHGLLQRESERFELVLGDGILVWERKDGGVRYPLLTRRVRLEFDPEIPEFTFIDDGDRTDFATALFRSMDDVDGRIVSNLREEVEQLQPHPLDGTVTSVFLRSVVTRLDGNGQYTGNQAPRPERDFPAVGREPHLFLRPRSQDVAAALERIIADIISGGFIPVSLRSIVGDHYNPEAATGSSEESALENLTDANEDSRILFTKPGNAEQLAIARKLDANESVIVQGPPGTGKTHTIANLLGHLLAQGKSVLVTSHTTKALQVLRDKVALPLQPLCLSVLNDSSRDNAELQASVAAIAERLGNSDIDSLDRDAERLKSERQELLLQICALRGRLLEVRLLEQTPIIVAGESVNPIDAAKIVRAGVDVASWIPGPLSMSSPLPLSVADLNALYATNGTIAAEDEARLSGWLPNVEVLPSPDIVDAWCRERRSIAELSLDQERELWNEERRDTGSADELDAIFAQANTALEVLSGQAPWTRAIAENSQHTAASQPWRELIADVGVVQELVFRHSALLSSNTPTLAITDDIDSLAATYLEIAAEVQASKKPPGVLTLLMRPSWKNALANSKIAGSKKPERPEHFQALAAASEIVRVRAALVRRWNALVLPLSGPELGALFSGNPPPEVIAKRYVPLLESALAWKQQSWEPIELSLVKAGLCWKIFKTRVDLALVDGSEIERIVYCVEEMLPTSLALEGARRRTLAINRAFASAIEQCKPRDNAALVALNVISALENEASEAYRAAYDEITRLAHLNTTLNKRVEQLRMLEKLAPTWAAQIRDRVGLHGSPILPGDGNDAWKWRQLHDELTRRDAISMDDLLRSLDERRSYLRDITAQLVDRLAWSAQIRRTTDVQRQALMGFVAAKKKIGAGTGKQVPRLRALAREQMAKSRPAVPVWIMPLANVAETVSPDTGKFDVVIIDEASQSDVTGLFALYLGKKVVVVGDSEQVSPLDVGGSVEITNQLADSYLQGIQNRQLYDGKLSLYDLAEQSFGSVLPLREHFRCAPEIIAFSNRFYNGAIKPLRERGPYEPAVVAHRVHSSGVLNNVNEDEARAIVTLVSAACDLPEYAENSDGEPLTFGVITMVGDQQAKRIEYLLRAVLPPTEIERRKIRVGNSAHFQGDERNVIFLSLVNVGAGEPLAIREARSQQQRFNVAASRAKDQLWVVHSLDHTRELKAGDLRRTLIEHALDPKAALNAAEAVRSQAESHFEEAVLERLVRAGFAESIIAQYAVGVYRIDIVIQGANGRRLAVECDGEKWHPPEALERDLARQADLERLGWRFVRIRGSAFYRDSDKALLPLFEQLKRLNIIPIQSEGQVSAESDLLQRVLARSAVLLQELNVQPIVQLQVPKNRRSFKGTSHGSPQEKND